MDHFTCALLGLIHFPPKTSHLGDPMHIFTFLCIRDDQFSKNLNFTTEGALKSKKLRKETMLEIEKYIKKHVGRKVLLTLTFSPSPTVAVKILAVFSTTQMRRRELSFPVREGRQNTSSQGGGTSTPRCGCELTCNNG